MSEEKAVREVEKLLVELDYDVSQWREEHRRLRELFIEAAEPLAEVMLSMTEAPGHRGFAVTQLLARGLNDVVVAFHLTLHGYLNQAYNEMRIAWEACDLIKLVGRDAEEATSWVESEQPWRDFRPGNVRKKLNQPKNDEIYAYFCSIAHPRFSGADLTGYMLSSPDGDVSSRLIIGPTPLIDERPYLAHAALFVGHVLGRLTLEAQVLSDVSDVAGESFSAAALTMWRALEEYRTAAVELMAKSGQPDAAEALDEMRALFLEPLKDL